MTVYKKVRMVDGKLVVTEQKRNKAVRVKFRLLAYSI
jgi:hypothetical protein